MERISIALTLCFALVCAACVGFKESSFFSNFSLRTMVEHNKSSAGLACDPNGGGGGGGIRISTGGFGFGRTRFSSHKGDGFACRLKSDAAAGFSETRLLAGLRL